MATLSRAPLDPRRSQREENSTDGHTYGGVREPVASLSLADKSRRTATPGEMLTPSDDEQDADQEKHEARPKLRSSARLIDRKNTPNYSLAEQQRPRTVPSPPQVRGSPGEEQKTSTEDESSERVASLETSSNLRKRQRAGSSEGTERQQLKEETMDHNPYQQPSGPSSHNSSADHSPYAYHHPPQHHQYPPSHPQHDYRPREYHHAESQYLPRPYDAHGPPPEPPTAYRGYYGAGGGPLPPLPPSSHHQSHHVRNDSSASSTAPYAESEHQPRPYGGMTTTNHFQPRGHHKPGSSSDGSAASSTSSSRVPFAAAGPIGTDQGVTGGHGNGGKDLICVCPKAPKVPRPRNVFILYRQAHQSQVGNENPGLANPEISKLIGERWRAEPEDVKDYWKSLAEREKERHSRQYPDYRYQPRRGGKNASSSSSRPVSASGEDPCRCGKCGGRFIATPRTPTTPFSGAAGGNTAGVTTPVSNKSIQSHHHPQPFISPDPRILETQHLRRGSAGSAMVDPYGRRYTQPPQLRDIDEGHPLVSPTSPPPSFHQQQQQHSAEKRRRTDSGYAAVISPTAPGPISHNQYPHQHPMAHDGPGPTVYGSQGGGPLPLPPPSTTSTSAAAQSAPVSGPHIHSNNHHHQQHTRQHSYPPPQPQPQRYQSFPGPSTSLIPEEQSSLPLPPSLPAPRRKSPFGESLRLPPIQAQGLPGPGPPSSAPSANISGRVGTSASGETTGLGIVHDAQRDSQNVHQQQVKTNKAEAEESPVGFSWQWKLDTMRAICPPLPQDGGAKNAVSAVTPTTGVAAAEEENVGENDDTRGPIIAVEGVVMLDENNQICKDISSQPERNQYTNALLLEVAGAVETALEGTCRFDVRKWGADDIEKRTKDESGDEGTGSNAVATEHQEGGKNKTSKTQKKEDDFASPLVTHMENMLKWHRASGEMIRYVTRRLEVGGKDEQVATPSATPSTANTEPADVAAPSSSAIGLAPAPLIHPAPRSSSSQRRWRHNQGVTPAALLPQGYNLSLTDRDAASLHFKDNYAAADHWRWVSTLWRGTVGADLSIVVIVGGGDAAANSTDGKDVEFLFPPPDDNMAAAQQLQNLARGEASRKTAGDLASSYSMVVRLPEGGHLDDKLRRRLGYELIEWIHAQKFSA